MAEPIVGYEAPTPNVLRRRHCEGLETEVSRSFPGGIVRYWDENKSGRLTRLNPRLLRDRVKVIPGIWHSFWDGETWKKRLQLNLFLDITMWKAGFIEFVGTFLITWMVLVISCSVLAHPGDYSYFPTAISILHIPLIGFMILATATTSGGHLNPMISFATTLAGLTEFPRCIVYIAFQIVASIAASYTAKHMLPDEILNASQLAMCSIGTQQSPSQALTLEIFCDFWVIMISFGVALDERQRQIFPPYFPPFIIGTCIAMLIYCTSALSAFGTGAIAYPTRCFGPAVAMGLLNDEYFILGNGIRVRNAQWIYWVGPFISSVMVALLYRSIPPGYMLILKEKQAAQSDNNNNNNNDTNVNNNNEIPLSPTPNNP